MDMIKRKKPCTLTEYLREIDEDIKAAKEQAGVEVDNDISDGPDPDDEESDARFNS